MQPLSLFDRWGSRVLIALIAAVPLFFWLDFYDAFDLPKMSLVYIAALLSIGFWGAQTLTQGRWTFRRTAWDVPLLLFLAATGLSTVFSIEPVLSLFGQFRIYVFGFLPIVAFAVLFASTARLASPRLVRAITTAALWAGSAVGFYGLLQYAGWELFDRMPGVRGGRMWSSLGNPVYMGALCGMALPLAAGRWVSPTLSRVRRIGVAAAVVLCLAGVTLSLSRSAWVGTVAAAFYLGWAGYRWRRAAAPVLAALLVLVGAAVLLNPSVRQRARVLFSTQEYSNQARLEGWKSAVRVWRAYPWLGSGPDTFIRAFRPFRSAAYLKAAGPEVVQADAHNDALQLAATQGLVGLALWGWLVVLFGIASWRLARQTGEDETLLRAQALAAGLIFLFVQNQFNFSSVATSAWAAVWAGLVFGTAVDSREGDVALPGSSRVLAAALGLCVMAGIWRLALRPMMADLWYEQGAALSAQRLWRPALDCLRQSVRLAPHVEDYGTTLANTDRAAGPTAPSESLRQALYKEAWGIEQDAVQRHAANPDTWNNRGVVAMWLSQLTGEDLRGEARQSFERALALDPLFVDAWANLARWEHLSGHDAEEKELWRKVLALDPAHPMARQVLGIQNL